MEVPLSEVVRGTFGGSNATISVICCNEGPWALAGCWNSLSLSRSALRIHGDVEEGRPRARGASRHKGYAGRAQPSLMKVCCLYQVPQFLIQPLGLCTSIKGTVEFMQLVQRPALVI
jgi:hypothetical protein